MAAYMIALTDMRNSDWIADYVRAVPAMIARFGGEYVAMGQAPETLEGALPAPHAATVFRFPDMAAIRNFLDSEEYRPYREARMAASDTQLLAFESEI